MTYPFMQNIILIYLHNEYTYVTKVCTMHLYFWTQVLLLFVSTLRAVVLGVTLYLSIYWAKDTKYFQTSMEKKWNKFLKKLDS